MTVLVRRLGVCLNHIVDHEVGGVVYNTSGQPLLVTLYTAYRQSQPASSLV